MLMLIKFLIYNAISLAYLNTSNVNVNPFDAAFAAKELIAFKYI